MPVWVLISVSISWDGAIFTNSLLPNYDPLGKRVSIGWWCCTSLGFNQPRWIRLAVVRNRLVDSLNSILNWTVCLIKDRRKESQWKLSSFETKQSPLLFPSPVRQPYKYRRDKHLQQTNRQKLSKRFLWNTCWVFYPKQQTYPIMKAQSHQAKHCLRLSNGCCFLVFVLLFSSLLPEDVQAKKKTSEIIIMAGEGRPSIYKSDNGKHKQIYIIGRRKRSLSEGIHGSMVRQEQEPLGQTIFLLPSRP